MTESFDAVTAMWDGATRDLDAEQQAEGFTRAKIAVASLWPFLASATSEEDLANRLALQSDRILAQVGSEQFDAVIASIAVDWQALQDGWRHEAALQVEAASKVAEGQDAMSYPAVAMYSTGGGGYRVDHIASPKWLKTIHTGDDEDSARQAARQFAVSQAMPLYVDGKRVEGQLQPGMEYLHAASGRWMPVFPPTTAASDPVGDVREQLKGLNEVCPGSGHYAGKGHSPKSTVGFDKRMSTQSHHCKHCGQDVPVVLGDKGKGFAMTHWPEGGGIFDKASSATLARFSAEQLNDEYGRFHNRADWELDSVHKALSMSERLNGPQEEARLEAVKRLKKERANGRQPVMANFVPDPSDAQRYQAYPPTPPSPQQGGSAAGPPAQMGPDGFPPDLSAGEQRSEIGYQRQLTPGAWTVTPGSEWRDESLPNAATGLPQGQFPGQGNPAVASLRSPEMWALGYSNGLQATGVLLPDDSYEEGYGAGLSATAGEGVVPTPGPNPNYFSQGSDGLQGPPSFPEDPAAGIEPKTDNRMDDVYGDVPPVASGGSQQNQTDGQGYSRQGVEAALQAEANQYIKQQGGKWVITQKGTGKVLSHHDSEEEANASFRAMMQSKHGQAMPPFGQAANGRTAAFNEGHVSDYVNWAKGEGHDPDHVKTLKRYEARPGIGKAHTNFIADQLYIGGGDENWRKSASTDGKIIGHCDNCHTPVRWHDGPEGKELRHLHNSKNRCSDGGIASEAVQHIFFDPHDASVHTLAQGDPMTPMPPGAGDQSGGANPNLTPASGSGTADTNVPQASDPNMPSQVTGMQYRADAAFTAPTSENPTGRGEDEYRARNWDSAVRQRPMQSPEDRNVNTPVLPAERIRTLDTDGPRERNDQDEDETDNQGADSREASLAGARR